MPVAEYEEEDETAYTSGCAQTSFSSHTNVVPQYVPEEERSSRSFRDACTRVSDWQSLSNDELTEEIARRLSTHRFAFASGVHVLLRRDYNRRDAFK